ncbi:hypothetical protein [Cupriavidus yeoncheonensis]|uniref:hypothetical protein n=1 Tax=Cupriavidus yeoncheonensis TaxID=1462994 RepID=UPI001BA766C5|nr:hypothetical protein [Cupriavidus yeoncheonensis]
MTRADFDEALRATKLSRHVLNNAGVERLPRSGTGRLRTGETTWNSLAALDRADREETGPAR